MNKVLVIIYAISAAMVGAAKAAPVSVVNSDFDSAFTLTNIGKQGDFALGASGWSYSGWAGTFNPDDTRNGSVYSTSSDPYVRVGFVNGGASLFQTLSAVIAPNTDYTLSAMFGHRFGYSFGGQFGFYVGDVNNIIGVTNIADPGEGLWATQSSSLDAAFLANYVGQQLGIVFIGGGLQFNIDNIFVEAVNVGAEVIENPLPGAVWLFGTALVAGGIFKRRKKKAA